MWWLAACTPELIDARFTPGEWTPAAGRLEWTGPTGGVATLEGDDGPGGSWRRVASDAVSTAQSSLPVALVPEGTWQWRLTISDEHGSVAETGTLDIPSPPNLADHELTEVDSARSELVQGGYWVGYQFGYRW